MCVSVLGIVFGLIVFGCVFFSFSSIVLLVLWLWLVIVSELNSLVCMCVMWLSMFFFFS